MQVEIGDAPASDGLFVCYVDNDMLPAFTERKMLMWFKGEWTYPMSDQGYRGKIYGYLGPLPIIKKAGFGLEYDL
jgi:hypothetical protein